MNKQAGCISVGRAHLRNHLVTALTTLISWTECGPTVTSPTTGCPFKKEATLKKETEEISGCELNVTTVSCREC